LTHPGATVHSPRVSTDLREASRRAGTLCLRGGGWEHSYQADPIIKPQWSQGLNRYAYVPIPTNLSIDSDTT